MPRTKGSKNHAKTDFDAQLEKLQKDKALLEEGIAKTVVQIEELKTDIKSLRESLKPSPPSTLSTRHSSTPARIPSAPAPTPSCPTVHSS